MSYKYSGKMGKGYNRLLRDQRREDAYARALAIWNNGTGMIYVGPVQNSHLKSVQHPGYKLSRTDARRIAYNIDGNGNSKKE